MARWPTAVLPGGRASGALDGPNDMTVQALLLQQQ
jgi:hypothetical protein